MATNNFSIKSLKIPVYHLLTLTILRPIHLIMDIRTFSRRLISHRARWTLLALFGFLNNLARAWMDLLSRVIWLNWLNKLIALRLQKLYEKTKRIIYESAARSPSPTNAIATSSRTFLGFCLSLSTASKSGMTVRSPN